MLRLGTESNGSTSVPHRPYLPIVETQYVRCLLNGYLKAEREYSRNFV